MGTRSAETALQRDFDQMLINTTVCWQRFSRTRARRERDRFTAKSISVTIQTDKRLILDTVLMQLRSVSLGVVRNVFHLLFVTGGKLQIVTSPRLFLLSFPGPITRRNPWAKNRQDTQTTYLCNGNIVSQFYCMFDQINAAFVCRRDLKKRTDILNVFVSEISVSAIKQINTIQVLGETYIYYIYILVLSND